MRTFLLTLSAFVLLVVGAPVHAATSAADPVVSDTLFATEGPFVEGLLLAGCPHAAAAAGEEGAAPCENCPNKADGECPHAKDGDCPHAKDGDCPHAKGEGAEGDCPCCADKECGDDCPHKKGEEDASEAL